MILEIVKYGHPVLRQKGKSIDKISPEIQKLVSDMLETMYDAQGVGLAAQQVGHALRLAVIDVAGVKDRPSWMEMDGQARDILQSMPLVLINPETTPSGDSVAGPEGCLSFPEIYSEITRPAVIDVRALDRDGKPFAFRCGGLLSRAVQHEVDHLNGILFIDRMLREDKEEFKPLLEELQTETKASLKKR